MRKELIALGFCILGMRVVAANESPVYTELWIGKSSIDDVSARRATGSINGITFSNVQGTVRYDDPTLYGLEVGATEFAGGPFRVGLSFQTGKAQLRSLSGSGTISNGTATVDLVTRLNAAQLRGIGVDFDNRVRMVGINAYYDFNKDSAFRPFVGLGFGQADIANAERLEFFRGLYLGVNYEISKNAYLGVRVSNYRIDGPTDRLGVSYEAIKVNNYGLHWGYRRY